MEIKTGTYLITGISGFIGTLVAGKLLEHPEYRQGNIKIIGLTRNRAGTAALFHRYDCTHIDLIEADIKNAAECCDKIRGTMRHPDYMIHCAAAAQSAYMVANPIETADSIVWGTRSVLELAQKMQIRSMVYLSSMEVYGNISGQKQLITEEQLGDIDILSVRSCYPLGKRMAEHYCYSYSREYDVPVKIARLAQVFGTGILPGENRVFAQFAHAVRENKDIVLHTAGRSMGNYCESGDAVNGLFTILYKGVSGEVYNVVNESNTMRICEMAQLVADTIAGGRIKVVYDIQAGNPHGYAADTGVRLSSAKLRKLGWKPEKEMTVMYREMLDWMERMQTKGEIKDGTQH